MGLVTGSKIQSGRSGATPRLGRLLLEGEVARGPASVVYAARLADSQAAESGTSARLAVKAYDPALRVLAPSAARFETATDERLARVRRGDETGDLPRDRLYRVTDLVRGTTASLAALGSLRATVAFFARSRGRSRSRTPAARPTATSAPSTRSSSTTEGLSSRTRASC